MNQKDLDTVSAKSQKIYALDSSSWVFPCYQLKGENVNHSVIVMYHQIQIQV